MNDPIAIYPKAILNPDPRNLELRSLFFSNPLINAQIHAVITNPKGSSNCAFKSVS